MVHVHGRDVAQRVVRIGRLPAERCLLVPVDVGKLVAMALVADATGERLVAPFMFTLDRPGLAESVQRVERVVARGEVQVEVEVDAAGHYHRPVTASSMLPADWTLLDLNSAHVKETAAGAGQAGDQDRSSIWRRCSIWAAVPAKAGDASVQHRRPSGTVGAEHSCHSTSGSPAPDPRWRSARTSWRDKSLKPMKAARRVRS